MRVAFVGTGAMGAPMAERVVRAGHEVAVWNRTPLRAAPVVAAGARPGATPLETAEGAELLVTVLADDRAVEEVVLEGGLLDALAPAAVHAGMGTYGVPMVERLAVAHGAAGGAYLAAPVFGRPDMAAAGRLRIVAAGPQMALARSRAVLDAMGEVVAVGERPRAAAAVKLAGNLLLAAAIEGLGEALALVRAAGADGQAFLDVVASGLFASRVYEAYGGLILAGRYEPAGFALRLGLKDVRLALATADAAGVPLPLASLLHDRLLAADNRGMGGLDWAALGRLAADDAGLT